MLTRINLIAYSYEHTSSYIVSTKNDLLIIPHFDIAEDTYKEDRSVSNVLKDIFNKHIDLDYSWSSPKLIDVDIFKSEDGLLQTHIFYSCYIPHKTKISGYWFLADNLLLNSKILQKALCLT